MATVYKTPGVYIEEISKLPPSIAQVETALPAFIGYTNKADDLAPNDLFKKPKRITSLLEYEQFFGGAPATKVAEVNIDSGNNFLSAKVSNSFYLYDSLRMFYANGGADCYIVSIGKSETTTTPAQNHFTDGIDELEKEDEPTIILFPDAVLLGDGAIAAVQQKALSQCGKLMDRVGLFDVKQNDPLGINFRNGIGINDLKYGAVYTPWLKVSLPKSVSYNDIKSVIKRSGIAVTLASLTTDPAIQGLIANIEQSFADSTNVGNRTKALNPPDGVLADGFNSKVATFNGPAGNTDGNLKAIFDYLYAIATQVDKFVNGPAPDLLTLPDFLSDVKLTVTSQLDPAFAKAVALNLEAEDDLTAFGGAYVATDFNTVITPATWPVSAAVAGPFASVNEADQPTTRQAVVNLLQPIFDEINTIYMNTVVKTSSSYIKTLDDSLVLAFPVYKSILTGVGNSMTVMPPSGSVAGVYSYVDGTRGVWKAPANVSLSLVLGPETTFTASQLENLNVNTIAGKSVNAIRYFTGKGTLVFGARTLAGNDNEWRYISTRRFFNMVEESCKKATEPFVFEPNDANTWVKVQGMIENFLTTLWRQGALQGAKPEHAFYVAVGLDKTMTALDILEGRMIVEIGMAVVRPAEFIILKFSHKLAQS